MVVIHTTRRNYIALTDPVDIWTELSGRVTMKERETSQRFQKPARFCRKSIILLSWFFKILTIIFLAFPFLCLFGLRKDVQVFWNRILPKCDAQECLMVTHEIQNNLASYLSWKIHVDNPTDHRAGRQEVSRCCTRGESEEKRASEKAAIAWYLFLNLS